MKSVVLTKLFTVLMVCAVPLTSHAANTPCSGKKGGVANCSAGKFICKDGSTSASKKTCS